MRECHICGRLYDLPDHPAGTMIPCACAEEIVALRAALEALYEAANTKDRVSLEDLEAAYDALNR